MNFQIRSVIVTTFFTKADQFQWSIQCTYQMTAQRKCELMKDEVAILVVT